MKTFSQISLKKYCNQLCKISNDISAIHNRIGYPPFWKRENNFESLCKTIIEQQVSLSSAQSSFKRLKIYCNEITPSNLYKLTPEEYRACGITKQKAHYLTLLANTTLNEPAFFSTLEKLDNEKAKAKLISLKGIGHWTANVYILVALNRVNVYPDFDVALINSISHEIFEGEKINNDTAKEFILKFSPLQSIACLYFYHAYIVRKNTEFIP